ncbi:MAG: YjbH domain-containing protein [Janthinobacterium lividum]
MKDQTGARVYSASCVLLCVVLGSASGSAFSQQQTEIKSAAYLGDWLSAQPAVLSGVAQPQASSGGTDLYSAGMQWDTGNEVKLQEYRRQVLLTELQYFNGGRSTEARQGLYDLVASRPATGRVILWNSDPRWLQANPKADPILQPGDKVVIPQRPDTVTVILENGSLCTVQYLAGAESLHYVRSCAPDVAADIAWVAQPDGRVQADRNGWWNEARQDPPAPGAWIWAPDVRRRWPKDVSKRIAEFFATQGPSGTDAQSGELRPAPAVLSAPGDGVPVAGKSRDLPLTSGDWGDIGVLQTPSARMAEAGEASVSLSYVNPYARLNFMFQPLSWVEFGFRYTDIRNHLYGPPGLSGTQTYKDKSIDAKFRLWSESRYVPQFAVGFRDIGGTGLFSGEYFVANKRFGDLDWSLGLGFGYLGERGDLPNPLEVLSSKFKTRPVDTGSGTLSYKSFFRGRPSLFGGVQYQTPLDGLILKLEYDGNDYKHEPFGVNLDARLPVNVGAVYQLNKNLDLSVGFERGREAMIGVAFHGNLSKLATVKVNDPSPPPISTLSPQGGQPADWASTAAAIEAQTQWRVVSIQKIGSSVQVVFDDPAGFYVKDKINRVAAILHRDAPTDVQLFKLVVEIQGLPVTTYAVQREQWVASETRYLPPVNHQEAIAYGPPPSEGAIASRPEVYEAPPKRLSIQFGPGYQQNVGGPNGFILYAVSADLNAEYRITPKTWIGGDLSYRLFDNYDKFTYNASSELPHVRTDLRQYETTSRINVPFLQLTHVGKIGSDQYYSLYGGLLEPMFAGIGAEYLYRPWGSPLAIGLDVNEVKQRGFSQQFSLMAYHAFTGHLTAYWDTGWEGVQINVSVGQYLAKDKGATLDISRRFQNGVSIGAYATKTNVSSAQFGEGSFDKGIYVLIPFDAILPRSTGGVANLRWDPLTRDGGAMLQRQYPLYDLTDYSDKRRLWYQPSDDSK